MARNGINQEQIFTVAKELALNGQLPTALKVRSKLATGSMATIQKYLQKWKKSCFTNINLTSTSNDVASKELFKKYSILEQTFNKQKIQNEHYAEQLIDAEKTNISLKEQNCIAQTIIADLQQDLQQSKKINHNLNEWYQKLQTAIEKNQNQTIQAQQKIIDDLRIELKILNETSILALRETSNNGHEALMKEKVISINLQAKIDNLNKELLESKKQLNEAIITSQVQNRSLLRQNEQLQKIIQEHGLVKFPQLEEELTLEFIKGTAVYGK